MKIEKLSFEHKDLLYDKLRNINSPIAEYSFSNLYLFRSNHKYEVIFDKEIFIRGISYDGFSYLMPIFDIKNVDYEYIKQMAKEANFLFPIDEENLSLFKAGDFISSYDEDDTDYVYTVEKMATYKGRNLHGKRNLLKQFVENFPHEAKPLTKDRIADALSILEQWQMDVDQSKEETDYYACKEALELYDEMILCGGIYYVGDEPAGFVMGEEINPQMFALHFAKGKKKYKGLYQYMYNTFAKILPEKYQYLNFEQDLGKLALKIAKQSYEPDYMIKKYRIKKL